MNLLERYLQAIGQYLPPSTRQDTLAELRANLLSQMDDRAEELNRPLTDAEVADILRAHGKPEQVALRYLPQRSLIGPTIFPFYLFTLRRALPLVLLIYTIVRASTILFVDTGNIAHSILQAVLQLPFTLLIFWAVVTIAFSVFEYGHFTRHSCTPEKPWDPTSLPTFTPTANKERSFAAKIVDLTLHCVWFLYVLAVPHNLFLIMGPGVFYLNSIAAGYAPVWHTFYTLLIVLLSVQLIIKIAALRPGPQPWKAPLEILVKLLSIAGAAILVHAKTYFTPTGIALNAHTADVINQSLNLSFKILLFVLVITLIVDLWKLIRPSIATERLAF